MRAAGPLQLGGSGEYTGPIGRWPPAVPTQAADQVPPERCRGLAPGRLPDFAGCPGEMRRGAPARAGLCQLASTGIDRVLAPASLSPALAPMVGSGGDMGYVPVVGPCGRWSGRCSLACCWSRVLTRPRQRLRRSGSGHPPPRPRLHPGACGSCHVVACRPDACTRGHARDSASDSPLPSASPPPSDGAGPALAPAPAVHGTHRAHRPGRSPSIPVEGGRGVPALLGRHVHGRALRPGHRSLHRRWPAHRHRAVQHRHPAQRIAQAGHSRRRVRARPAGLRRSSTRAHARGIRVLVSFTSGGYQNNARLFGDQPAMDRFVAEATALVAARGLDGADLDIELIDGEWFDAYAATAGRPEGPRSRRGTRPARVMVATNGNRSGARMAKRAIAAGVDRAFLMGYAYRGPTSSPVGSIAPLDRADDGLDLRDSLQLYQDREVPLDQVIIGLPAYGLTWATVGPELHAERAPAARLRARPRHPVPGRRRRTSRRRAGRRRGSRRRVGARDLVRRGARQLVPDLLRHPSHTARQVPPRARGGDRGRRHLDPGL